MSKNSDFSWRQLFADHLIEKRGSEQVEVPVDEALQGKHVAVYFSAHWCPPCRTFTPQLVRTYDKLRKDGQEFEVVFVSMDKSQAQFDEYFAEMPWLAVPWKDDQLRSVLGRKFQVMGIPQLVVLAPDSTVLSSNARSAVTADPNGQNFPWQGSAHAEPRAFPMPWLLMAFLVFWLIQTFVFPPKPKS